LLVMAVIAVVVARPWPQKIAAILVASIGWRFAFMGVQGLRYALSDFTHVNLTSWRLFTEFTLFQGFLSGVIAVAFVAVFLRMVKPREALERKPWLQPHYASALFVLALVLTYVL